jgi:hypothetical protein
MRDYERFQVEDLVIHSCFVEEADGFFQGWEDEVQKVAMAHSTITELRLSHRTSRDSPDVTSAHIRGVGGLVIMQELPWLYGQYHDESGSIRQQAQSLHKRVVVPSEDPGYGVSLHASTSEAPGYEVHVDSNPLQAMLYVGSHEEGEELKEDGELVFSLNKTALGVEEVEAGPKHVVRPRSGQLLMFDARRHPHYVRQVKSGERVALAMNYYFMDQSLRQPSEDLKQFLSGKPTG